jgi:hypothetical protein
MLSVALLAVGAFNGMASAAQGSGVDKTSCYAKVVPSKPATSCSTAWKTHYTACTTTSTRVSTKTVLASAPAGRVVTTTITVQSTTGVVSTTTIPSGPTFTPVRIAHPDFGYNESVSGPTPFDVQGKKRSFGSNLVSDTAGLPFHDGLPSFLDKLLRPPPKQYPGPVTCHRWTASRSCSTKTVTSTSTVFASPSASLASAAAAARTVTVTATALVPQPTQDIFRSCSPSNLADSYDGAPFYTFQSIGEYDAPLELLNTTTAYDCCVGAFSLPDFPIEAWTYSVKGRRCNLYLDFNAFSCPAPPRWVAVTQPGTRFDDYLTVGNGPCGAIVGGFVAPA